MKELKKVEKVDPLDPNRCNGTTKSGQCLFKAIPGGKYCIIHGGSSQVTKNREEAKRNYLLGKWQSKLDSKLDTGSIKTLREEIGILRMLMEERFSQIEDSSDLLLHSHALSELALKIEKLVTSCHKLETSLKLMLDQEQAARFALEVIEIIGNNITDADILENISNQIQEKLDKSFIKTEEENF